MRLGVTDEGNLLFQFTELEDWKIFEDLVVDAEGRGKGWLAKRLGVLMDDEDWDEYIVPSLNEQFQGEITVVRDVLRKAYDDFLARPDPPKQPEKEKYDLLDDEEDKEELNCGELQIFREVSGTWYSVLNQARLALEGKWKLAALEDEEDMEELQNIDQERLGAYLRYGFYTRIQGLLLEYLMDL